MLHMFPRSPTTTARLAGGSYLLTIGLGMAGELVPSPQLGDLATLLSFGCYVGVTLLLYQFFAPANSWLSRLAMGNSLLGCTLGALRVIHWRPIALNPLVFFGLYCLLLSGLGWRSRLLPRWLSGLLAVAGLGWLTFLFPTLAPRLGTYTMLSGLVGEGALALWLLLAKVSSAATHATHPVAGVIPPDAAARL